MFNICYTQSLCVQPLLYPKHECLRWYGTLGLFNVCSDTSTSLKLKLMNNNLFESFPLIFLNVFLLRCFCNGNKNSNIYAKIAFIKNSSCQILLVLLRLSNLYSVCFIYLWKSRILLNSKIVRGSTRALFWTALDVPSAVIYCYLRYDNNENIVPVGSW